MLDAAGTVLAGDAALADRAGDLDGERRTGDEVLVAVRSATHAVVVACGPHVLTALQLHDLRTVLEDLAPSVRTPEA